MYMLNAQMNKRIDWIDISKGIGVILLVIGHMPSIPYVIQNKIGFIHFICRCSFSCQDIRLK